MSNIDQPMNVSAGAPTDTAPNADAPTSVEDKGKGKSSAKLDDAMDEDDDDEDEDDEEEEDGDHDEEIGDEEDDFAEIDPSVILPTGRRTRGIKVDYTSTEALQKAGLENGADAAEGDEEEEFVAQDNGVKAD